MLAVTIIMLAILAMLIAPSLAVDNCSPPGDGMCAFMVSADTLAFPTLSSNGAIL